MMKELSAATATAGAAAAAGAESIINSHNQPTDKRRIIIFEVNCQPMLVVVEGAVVEVLEEWMKQE